MAQKKKSPTELVRSLPSDGDIVYNVLWNLNIHIYMVLFINSIFHVRELLAEDVSDWFQCLFFLKLTSYKRIVSVRNINTVIFNTEVINPPTICEYEVLLVTYHKIHVH